MKVYLLVGVLLVAGLQAQPPGCTVIVHTKTGIILPTGMFPEAGRRVTAMFREIGVAVRFADGSPKRPPLDACGAPIIVQLEDSRTNSGLGEAMAYALPYQQSGTAIHIFADRILKNQNRAFASAVLSHVLAHEITHVLQRVNRHSLSGVMKPQWSAADYLRMERSPLPFTREDVLLIRSGLSKRTSHALSESTNLESQIR